MPHPALHGRDAARRPTAHCRRRSPLARALVVCALALFAAGAPAQSGRRLPPPKADPPVPVPTPEATPEKPKVEAKKIPVHAMFDGAASMSVSLTLINALRDVFGRRLREARALDVTADETTRGRGEAQKRAKEETERHVVWVSLVASPYYNDPLGTGRPRTDDMRIEYVIYAPVTGKAMANGNVYLRPNRGGIGRNRLPGCYPSVYALDYEFVEAAIEAGNRVIAEFNLPPPPVCP